jgi:hypothetical protein
MKYWISVVSNDQVQAGVEGGFIQAAQNKAGPIQALAKGDVIFFYAPGTLFRGGKILQAFTATARVADDEAYPTEMSAGARTWRRKATSLVCDETPIAPLISRLDFIRDKAAWEMSLRRGMFEIGNDDARRIAEAMHADIEQ